MRTGFYCWAGPGTIDMIKLKFFNPSIDEKSLLGSYDLDYLLKLKDKLGITDFWGMYSWGFNDSNEKAQREFLINRINNFKKANLKLHAYVQGPNVVYKDFIDKDWYARDNKNRLITYYRGRKVVCLNNPNFMDYKLQVINEMLKYDFDGIYMDNIQMGQMAIPTYKGELPFVFAGCNCKVCQQKFYQEYNEVIPLDFERDKDLTKAYLEFRIDSTTNFLKLISNQVKEGHKEFGTNSFDPKFNTEYVFGANLKELAQIQDYLLFENHSLPGDGYSNKYIDQLIQKLNKPTFVVSYKKGIGLDQAYTEKDLDNIYSEEAKSHFFVCIKGCEYCTNNIWHNLYIDNYTKPQTNSNFDIKHKRFKKVTENILFNNFFIRLILKRYYNQVFTLFMENFFIRKVFVNLSAVLIR